MRRWLLWRCRVKLKPGRWLGYSADTDDDKARESAARRLGCAVEELEVKSNGGAVIVRRKGDKNDS